MTSTNQLALRPYIISQPFSGNIWINIFLKIDKKEFHEIQASLKLVCYAFYTFFNEQEIWRLKCIQDFNITFTRPVEFKGEYYRLVRRKDKDIGNALIGSRYCIS